MGRLNTIEEQASTLQWASEFCAAKQPIAHVSSVSDLRLWFGADLRYYFALAALSRSTSAPTHMVNEALELVFRVRVTLEKAIATTLNELVSREGVVAFGVSTAPIHGYSKKQGVSIRMPLSSCVPSKVCGAACYSHDVLDAAPASVVRGAINGALAAWYEGGNERQRTELLTTLSRPVRMMVTAAQKDAHSAAATFLRRARIRFAHVGEFSAFPQYANALAQLVRDSSGGEVDCVVYTRHPDAKLLDPDLFTVLFSLDESSEDRRRFIPPTAKVVRSAFGGKITESVDVNFLEHHRWSHLEPIGSGKICPSTAPYTEVRTCDACKCDFCFSPKLISLAKP